MYKKAKLALLLVLALSLLALPGRSLAATNQIYLSPNPNTVQAGDNFTVSLRINPGGTAINGAQATISYNPSNLQYISIDTASSAFPTALVSPSGGNGNVVIVQGILGGSITSDSLIANITFKALVGSGSATLGYNTGATYSPNATSATDGSYTNPTPLDTTVNFTPVPAAPTPTVAPKVTVKTTTPTTTTPGPTATPAPTTAVLTTTLKTVEFNLVNLRVASNIPVQVALKYGTSSSLSQTRDFSALGTDNTVSIDPTSLIPGTTYYYEVVAKDGSGNTTQGVIKSFTTKGYTLKVTVLDSHNQPLADKTITLHSAVMTAKTDKNGVATFTNVAPGAHHVEYANGAKTYTEAVYVDNNVVTKGGAQTAVAQNAAVVLAGYTPAKKSLPLTAVLIPLVVLIIGATVLIIREPKIRAKLKFKLPFGKHIPSVPPVSAHSTDSSTSDEEPNDTPPADSSPATTTPASSAPDEEVKDTSTTASTPAETAATEHPADEYKPPTITVG